MSKKLTNPPLTYVLAQVKIGPILAIEKYVPELQEVARRELGLPQYVPAILRNIELKAGQNQASINELKQWHFLDLDRTTGVVLSDSSIIAHTSKYQGFEALMEILESVLQKFSKNLGIKMCDRMGLRYINVVRDDVEASVKKELLGFCPHLENEVEDPKFLISSETIKELKSGILKVKSAYVSRTVMNREQNNLVPLDLAPTTETLLFDHLSQPQGDFVTLDIDHFMDLTKKPRSFDVADIIGSMGNLHSVISDVFKHAVTEKALQAWK